MPIELVPLILLSPVLVATAFCDLRQMRIPNLLSVVAIVIFLGSTPLLLTIDAILMRMLAGGTALLIGFVMFGFRLVGGGDVKIFAALMLFVPGETMSVFLLLFSGAILFGVALMPILRALPNGSSLGWVSLKPGAGFPMGIAIALSGLAHPVMTTWLRV